MSETPRQTVLFDFADPASIEAWLPIDDRVMGGVSRSRLRHDPAGHAAFEGNVSLARNGGFASIRSRPAARGKPHANACVLDVCGDSKRYKLNLLTDDAFDGISYQASFGPLDGEWQTVRIPIGDFRPTFRGREVPSAPALEPALICQVGLMIADRQAGPFCLAVRLIGLA